MAKAKTEIQAIPDIPEAPLTPPPAPEQSVIIEKYLATRDDIAPVLKNVLCVVYRSQVNTISGWVDIVNKRLSKSAD